VKRSEREKQLSQRMISRRALMLGGLQVGIAGTLMWRLRDMQLNQTEQFHLLAEEKTASTCGCCRLCAG